MFRGPYFKGLLSPFDFIRFCKVHNIEPVIKDFWGKEHNLIKENIQILFTVSQFKLAKYYRDWQEYKDAYKRCGCAFGITQFEEDEFQEKNMNYQFIQSMTDFTNEEIEKFTAKTHQKILDLAKNSEAMLRALKADKNSFVYDKVALALYPELLRDGYSRSQLKDTKKRMLQDAKSGAIRCQNKRLFAIPDWYAACQAYFLKDPRPVGLVKKDEIVCRPFIRFDRVDVLRSPHLFMEHFIAKVSKDPKVYEWLCTDGIYTSVHSLISRVLQFDEQ